MFLGHHAVALAAKKVAPHTSFGTLVLASQFNDLLWPVLLLLKFEHVRFAPGSTAFSPFDFYDYPISHSLLTVLGWAVGFGGLYYILRKYPRGSLVVGVAVMSHWILDFLSHRADMPLAPGSDTVVGLGLWNSVAATLLVEAGMFAAGLFLYLKSTRAKDRQGIYALWPFVALLIAIYVGSIAAQGPVTQEQLGIGGLTQWLLVPWAYWIDRHREAVVVR